MGHFVSSLRRIKKFSEGGVLEIMKERKLYKSNLCASPRDFESFGLLNTMLPFFQLAVGILVAVVIVLLERKWAIKRNSEGTQ